MRDLSGPAPWLAGAVLGALLLGAGCRGVPPGPVTSERLEALVDSLRPSVERAAGLTFHSRPRSTLTTRDAVRGYLRARVAKDFPPARREGIQAAYRLLGLLPDSLDLERLLLDLYTEQVVGYYDPDSTRLYAVEGGDPTQLRLVMAHEMVHALQHQYLPLDSLLQVRGNGDALAAAQAVLEGQATLASIRVLAPGRDVPAEPGFWETYREQVRVQQDRMPVFAKAPLVLRQGLIFPYVQGAEFMHWWAAARGSPLPRREELPGSTEQVLHPERYAAGDAPVAVAFADSSADVWYEDTLGELETQVLAAVLRGGEVTLDLALGWGGDRYRVVRTPQGPALIWYAVWDGPQFADRFAAWARAGFPARAKSGYRLAVDRLDGGGGVGPAVRVVRAPEGWAGWARLPRLRATGSR